MSFEEQMVLALRRMAAASLIELFGDADSKRAVSQVFDRSLPEDQRVAARAGLDRVAGKMFPASGGSPAPG